MTDGTLCHVSITQGVRPPSCESPIAARLAIAARRLANSHIRMPSARVEALLARVEPEYKPLCRKMVTGGAFSFAQAWQDWWLFHNLFSDRLTWGEGTYVDIGTHAPESLSNTLFFDKCLGWSRSVCFEPNPAHHAAIKSKRSCALVPHCVLDRPQNVSFGGSNSANFHVVSRGGGGGGGGGGGSRGECVVAQEALEAHSIARIDLLSIGAALNISNILRSTAGYAG